MQLKIINIKSYLKNSRLTEFEKIGREDVKAISKEISIPITDDLIEKNIAKFSQGKSIQEIYSLIAQGKIKKKEFLKVLFPNLEKEKLKDDLILEKGKTKILNPF